MICTIPNQESLEYWFPDSPNYLGILIDVWLTTNKIKIVDNKFIATIDQLNELTLEIDNDIVDLGVMDIIQLLDGEAQPDEEY